MPWHFQKGKRDINVKVDAALVFNSMQPILQAGLEGIGLVYTLADYTRAHVARGRLIAVLDDWCPTYQGYHLYYPSRRHHSPAFSLLLDALKQVPA